MTATRGLSLPAVLLLAAAASGGDGILGGYADHAGFLGQVAELGRREGVEVRSLGRTRGGRDVLLLTISAGEADRKPALLVLGATHPPHLAGAELALRLARRLAAPDPEARRLVERATFYVIPRPSPDACEAFFTRPRVERAGNARATDDDRDGEV
ncbi:MAG: M14 family zinc carboxypeptidase, partial [Planctomycetota bacterium]